jgi:hypothetical protein
MSSAVNNAPRRTFVADALLPAYNIVKFVTATDNHVALATSATDKIAGVVQTATASGDVADIVLRNAQGTYKVLAGGTIHVGDYLTTNSSSVAIATTNSGDILIGQAMQEAVSGDIFEYLPTPSKY